MLARQVPLFDERPTEIALVRECGDVVFYPGFLDRALGLALFTELRGETTWSADSRMMYGKRVLVPRETASRGDGTRQPWSPLLLQVKDLVQVGAGVKFDYVFINRYRNGNDSVAWHNDNDADADPRLHIASLTLGATRTFDLRPRITTGLRQRRISVDVEHGDLIIMRGETQRHWQHRIAKDARVHEERINLTFRQR
jgi:alkylated DNA repair dioxygenase AlkB